MKIKIYLFSILFVFFGLSYNVSAQYTELYDFTGEGSFLGSHPKEDQNLINVGGVLFGMTHEGGLNNQGVIFKINPDGTGYTILLNFDGNTTGGGPCGSLIYDGTYLYGVTDGNGPTNVGTIFKIKPDGTGYVTLLNFDGTNGDNPTGSLFSDGTYLYGMTWAGGAKNFGTIFKIKPDGTSFVKLLDFDAADFNYNYSPIPSGSLISDGTYLYGTTKNGGSHFKGTIFKIKPDGTDYMTIATFDGTTNGQNPTGTLTYDGTFLYGMATMGGPNIGDGTIFKIKPDGTEFNILLDFEGSNGAYPKGSLFYDGTYLYGMTSSGSSSGTAFKIKPDGTGFVKLLNFDGTNGAYPIGSFISDGTYLYSMTYKGGITDLGTIFKIMPDGSGYNKLWTFAGASYGGIPTGSLISDGNNLYGMTSSGGAYNKGVIFTIKPDGTGYKKLLEFNGTSIGGEPKGDLISLGTFLYGMTTKGGLYDYGTLFKIKPDGTGYTKLLDFHDYGHPSGSLIFDGTYFYGMTTDNYFPGNIFKIKPDGTGYSVITTFNDSNGKPTGSLIFDGTYLYGRANGIYDNAVATNTGSIFKIKPDGTSYTKLYDFGHLLNSENSLISDGTYLYGISGTIFKIKHDGTDFTSFGNPSVTDGGPIGGLLYDGTYLYGITSSGGTNDYGVLFKVMPDGTNYTKLFDFNYPPAPTYSYPQYQGSLISVGTSLYGMTHNGGSAHVGSIFKYELSSTPTGISEVVTDKKLNIYPNPTNGIFQLNTIQVKSNTAQLLIYNELGENIYSTNFAQLNNGIINLSSQPSGIYFVNIYDGATIYSDKISIQH